MHHPTDRIAHTTAFVTPVVEHWLEREIGLKRKHNIAILKLLFMYFHPEMVKQIKYFSISEVLHSNRKI